MTKLCRKLATVALLLACAANLGRSQTQSNPAKRAAPAYRSAANANLAVTPEQVGLSSQRLDRVGDAIQQSIHDGRIAGAVSQVARHGKIVYFKAFGMAQCEAGPPMLTSPTLRRKNQHNSSTHFEAILVTRAPHKA